MARSTRAAIVDVAAIAALHALACAIARAAGFDHVSDDDFARVTIAQAFAHAPKLDPSGTSWLPFPFWVLGTALAAFGRSLAVARVVSVALASLAATTPYLALRAAGVPRLRALPATAFAYGTPWAVWLGAATVPESFAASLTAAASIGLGAAVATGPRDVRTWLFALGLVAACLSRYEPWPVAAIIAVALAARARAPSAARAPSQQVRWLLVASACALGPIVWMAWNAHAHDGPLHFFRRVSGFKRAIGEGSTDVASALLLYPRLLLERRPEVLLAAIAVAPAALRDPEHRRRWGLTLACALAQVAFLAYGNARDGAPAHHPERALLGTFVMLALFAADVGIAKVLDLAAEGRTRMARIGAAGALALWATSVVRGSAMPGSSPAETRAVQLRRGEELRAQHPTGIVLTPCAYEHFALMAAFSRPEDVEVRPRTGAPVSEPCPAVGVR